MLVFDYSAGFAALIRAIDWQIRLPPEWDDFFHEKGIASSCHDDRRRHQRMNVRTPALLWFERPLPAFPRDRRPVGIYTRDLSRRGVGLITPMQLYPEEIVRAVLKTFWVEVRVVSCRRVTEACYIAGTELVTQHAPGRAAFRTPDHDRVDETEARLLTEETAITEETAPASA